jgi:outer membrane murein-binding lipoprotein Lpp
MSPVEVALLMGCAVLLVAVTGTVVVAGQQRRLRRLDTATTDLATTVDRLREQVEELARRESARETAEVSTPPGPHDADWVITFDRPGEPQEVSTQHVVGTALGEPLIKMAALSHGVRRALREERRAHLVYQVRREYRRRRKSSRSRARAGR